MRLLFYILMFSFVITLGISEESKTISIIVNKSVTDDNFDQNILSDIYTLNKQYWQDGSKVVVVDKKGEDQIKIAFYKRLNLSISKLQKIWIRKQFSGKGQAPKTFKTQREIVNSIENTPGAIGYVHSDSISNNVRVIATITI